MNRFHIFMLYRGDDSVPPKMKKFDPPTDSSHVRLAQVWGDVVLVGDYFRHREMTRHFMETAQDFDGGTYRIGLGDRTLGCTVAGLQGSVDALYWNADPHPAGSVSGEFVTPFGVRTGFRLLFHLWGVYRF